ncbi:Calpain-like cysteine peptidase [Cichlidogyrus casuarinus]|uniref:Calpain-like cysteine peptidase n=1 Tax=Cichlidogyrus casuarinus TaxID=1844966 RepID=A0ABD2QK45_9PLAT
MYFEESNECEIKRIFSQANGTPGPGFVLPVGYTPGQVFSVTDCRKLRLTDQSGMRLARLVRIRNLWPIAKVGWVGAWSEASSEWLSLSSEDRVKVGLVKQEGEFWMDLDDFITSFDFLDICHICERPPGEKFSEDPQLQLQLPRVLISEKWYEGVSAGGRPFNKITHWANPQYLLNIPTPDENDPDFLATVVIGLMQVDDRNLKYRAPRLTSIGFVLYRLLNGSMPPMRRDFFDVNSFFTSVDYFFDSREVVKRFRLPVGSYLFVPCTYTPDHRGEFIIRALFEQEDRQFHATRQTIDLQDFAVTGPEIDENYEILQPRVRRMFYEASGETLTVDAFKLESILCEILTEDHRAPYKLVNTNACKALVMLMDRGDIARMSETDFRKMWSILRAWTRYFAAKDPNRTQYVTSLDFRIILETAGYILPHSIMAGLTRRYADAEWRISYSSFIEAMCLVTKSIALFSQYDNANVGTVNLTLEPVSFTCQVYSLSSS